MSTTEPYLGRGGVVLDNPFKMAAFIGAVVSSEAVTEVNSMVRV